MTKLENMILVFKTDVTNKRQSAKVGTLLQTLQAIREWSFDLEDCDKVLRIVGEDLHPGNIENLLFSKGFYCKELED